MRSFSDWDQAVDYCERLRTLARVHNLSDALLFQVHYLGEEIDVEVHTTAVMAGLVMRYSIDERIKMKL
jgi:hypothetical protein